MLLWAWAGGRTEGVLTVAHVAGGPHGDIELVVRPETDPLPLVSSISREVVIHHDLFPARSSPVAMHTHTCVGVRSDGRRVERAQQIRSLLCVSFKEQVIDLLR